MKEIRIRNDDEFGRILTAIDEDMVAANLHWRLYQHLLKSIPKFEQELNQARGFWSLTFNAHKDATLWRLGRLYDPTNGALSLPNFLKTISNNLSYFDENDFRRRLSENEYVDSLASQTRRPTKGDIQQDIERVTAKTDPLVKVLVDIRNKHLGHHDSRAALGRIMLPGLDANKISELLKRAREIVNQYNYLYRATTSAVQMVGEDDYLDVLKSVRLAIQIHEAAINKEIAESDDRDVDL